MRIGNTEFHDFAVSFAGEDRDFTEKLVESIKNEGLTVFYDNDKQAEMLGKDLFKYLRTKYAYQCKYIICIISDNYTKKAWTQLEMSAIQDRMLETMFRSDFLIPVLLGTAQLPSNIPQTIGFERVYPEREEDFTRLVKHLTQKAKASTQFDTFISDITPFAETLISDVSARINIHEVTKDNLSVTYELSNSQLALKCTPDHFGVSPCLEIEAYDASSSQSSLGSFPNLIITWDFTEGLSFTVYDFDTNSSGDSLVKDVGYGQLVQRVYRWANEKLRKLQ